MYKPVFNYNLLISNGREGDTKEVSYRIQDCFLYAPSLVVKSLKKEKMYDNIYLFNEMRFLSADRADMFHFSQLLLLTICNLNLLDFRYLGLSLANNSC